MVKTKKNKKIFSKLKCGRRGTAADSVRRHTIRAAPDRIGAKKMQFKPYGGLNCVFFVPVPRRSSIAVIFALVGTVHGDADVICLFTGEGGEMCAQFFQMESCHFFVQLFGEACNADGMIF